MKRKLLAFALFMSTLIGVMMPVSPVSAAGGCDDGFAGFVPWHYKVPNRDGNCNVQVSDEGQLKTTVAVVISNVAVDLSMAIGYIAVAMIGWGGYLYILSNGEPNKLVSAKKTITSAIIGLVIAMSASNVAKFLSGTIGTSGNVNPMDLIKTFLSIAGIVSVAMIVMSGFKYVMAQGAPEKVKQATQGIIWSVVGLLVTILAFAIVNFVIGAI